MEKRKPVFTGTWNQVLTGSGECRRSVGVLLF